MDVNIGQKILSKDLENIVKKVASGKTLTTAERALIESEYGKSGNSKTYADSIVELADILGVSRRTIGNWRKIKGAPKVSSNGKHNIAKWRTFISNNGLKEPDTPDEEELKSRKLLAESKASRVET